MTRRALPNVAAQEIDNALMDLAVISRRAAALAKAKSREESLTAILEIVIHTQSAERALRNAKTVRPDRE